MTLHSAPRLLCALFVAACTLPSFGSATERNPVVYENARQGSEGWKISRAADDTNRQIKGYADLTSVGLGQTIRFKVSVNRPQTYRIDIYRMGWYGGAGGRLMASQGGIRGTTQSAAIYDPDTGMVSYDWQADAFLNVPWYWTSGIYLAKLTNAEGYQNYISFVVRDDFRRSDLVYQQPVTTYQAYNAFPRGSSSAASSTSVDTLEPDSPLDTQAVTTTVSQASADIGKSLYEFNSSSQLTTQGTSRALKVSFDRPYEGWGDGQFFNWEIYLVQWLERNGFDVSYITNIDLHQQRTSLLRRHRGFISAGHDEYWSADMYDAVERARDKGVDLAFLGSNAVYWQVRLERGADGAKDRVLVCYKQADLDPARRASDRTVKWRDIGRAEQALIGVQYETDNQDEFNTDFIVENVDSWVYRGTGFREGDRVAGLTGYEVDRLFDEYPQPKTKNQTLLSASPYTGRDGTRTVAQSSIYQAPSGAWVYAAGTMSLPWALGRDGFVDDRIGILLKNVLTRMSRDRRGRATGVARTASQR